MATNHDPATSSREGPTASRAFTTAFGTRGPSARTRPRRRLKPELELGRHDGHTRIQSP